MTCFPDKEKPPEKKSVRNGISRMIVVLGLIAFVSVAVVNTASADAVSDLIANNTIQNIFTLLGTVFAGIAEALYLGFVVPLGTWLILGMIGMFFVIISGAGAFAVKFMFSMMGNMEQKAEHRYKK